MLENFRKIYNKELKHQWSENTLDRLILNSTEIRAFVYEICKECVDQENRNSTHHQCPTCYADMQVIWECKKCGHTIR